METVHSNKTVRECPVDGCGFKTELGFNHFQKHEQFWHSHSDFECKVCNDILNTRFDLRLHRIDNHIVDGVICKVSYF